MEDLMAPEIFVSVIENRKFQRINHASHRIDNTSCQKPSESRRGHVIENLSKSQYTGPSHSDIKNGRYPLGAIYPERFDQNSGNRNRPYDGQKNQPRLPFQDNQANRRITACNQYRNHHVINLFQNRIHLFRDVKCMICGTCRIQ